MVHVALLLVLLLAPGAQAKVDAAAERGLEFLADRAATSGPLAANIAEAAAANGHDPAAWPPGDPVAARVVVPGDGASNISLLRPLRALALAGDPRAGPVGDLTERVAAHLNADGYGDPATLNDDAYAVLALSAARPLDDAGRWGPIRRHLEANQHPEGGWGWAVGSPPGTDTTGLVVEALFAAGGAAPVTNDAAAAFLDRTRDADGGFAESPGGQRNCESTVWGIRASARLGRPTDADDWDFLLGLQGRDGGFAHLEGGRPDLLCTTEATALLGEALSGNVPLPAVEEPRSIPAEGAAPAMVILAMAAVAMSTRIRHP